MKCIRSIEHTRTQARVKRSIWAFFHFAVEILWYNHMGRQCIEVSCSIDTNTAGLSSEPEPKSARSFMCLLARSIAIPMTFLSKEDLWNQWSWFIFQKSILNFRISSTRTHCFYLHKAQDNEKKLSTRIWADVCSLFNIIFIIWMVNWLQYITPIPCLFRSLFHFVFSTITFAITTTPTTTTAAIVVAFSAAAVVKFHSIKKCSAEEEGNKQDTLVATNYNVRVVIYCVYIWLW